MSVATAYTGLCSGCQNAPECTFPREPGRPVWQCEEFTDGEPHLERSSCEGTAPGRTGLIVEERDGGNWAGLCRNCDNRKSCNFPKPDCGVWHCDEYI